MSIRLKTFTLLLFVLIIFLNILSCGSGGGGGGTNEKSDSKQLDYSLPHVKNQLVVKLKAGSTTSVTGILSNGASSVQNIDGTNLHLIDLAGMNTDDAYSILSSDPTVEIVQLNYKYSLIWDDGYKKETLYQDQDYLHDNSYDTDLDLEKARQAAIANNDVIVAVIDTGCDLSHEDLQGVLVDGYDFIHNDTIPDDDHGHGTFCAGQIAAQINGIGTSGIAANLFSYHKRGIKIMPVKFLDASGGGTCWNSAKAIRFAVDNGARVLSCSFGGRCDGYAVRDAIEYAQKKGAVLVAAAGNSGLDADGSPANMIYPMGYPHDNILSLGSIERDGSMAPYSTYGTTSVDAVGIGSDAFSLLNNNAYGLMSGTSMVAPQGAAIVAMMFSLSTDISNTDAVDIVKNNVVKDPYLSKYVSTGGRINALLSIRNTPYNGIPPKIDIISPINYEVFDLNGQVVFKATATDFEDGSIAAGNISWNSDIDGFLGSGHSAGPLNLSEGVHQVTASATDSDGNYEEKSIVIYVNLNPPTVAIIDNRPDVQASSMEFVDLLSDVYDEEDGSNVSSVRWESNIDGHLAYGPSFSGILSPGAHTVSCVAMDSDNLYGAAIIRIDVREAVFQINDNATSGTVLPGKFIYGAFDAREGMVYSGFFKSSQRVIAYLSYFPGLSHSKMNYIDKKVGVDGSLSLTPMATGTYYFLIEAYDNNSDGGAEFEAMVASEDVDLVPIENSNLIEVGIKTETFSLLNNELMRFHVWAEAGELYEILVDGTRNPKQGYESQRLVDTFYSTTPSVGELNYKSWDEFSNEPIRFRPDKTGFQFIAIKDRGNIGGSSYDIIVTNVSF